MKNVVREAAPKDSDEMTMMGIDFEVVHEIQEAIGFELY